MFNKYKTEQNRKRMVGEKVAEMVRSRSEGLAGDGSEMI